MNQDVTIAILTYTIVMLVLNIVKDYIIRAYKHNIPASHIGKSNKRWWIAYSIGLIILYLLYGRGSP